MRKAKQVAFAVATAAVLPGAVDVNQADAAVPMRKELGKYSHLYYAVRHLHGTRAPGRNIRKYGVHVSHRIRSATAHEIAASIRQLRLLRVPMLTPSFPRRPPAGIMSARPSSVLTSIASCESGGDPRAVDPSGTYRGKYQFDFSTWRSVGGKGDPAVASESEQDQRAAKLYSLKGPAPWPICGYR